MDTPEKHNLPQGGLDGLSTLNFSMLTPTERFIVRFVLRHMEADYAQICEAADELPPEKHLSRQELDDTLADLTERAWLLRREEGGTAWYRVHFKNRATRQAGSSPLKDAWDSLAADEPARDSPGPVEKPAADSAASASEQGTNDEPAASSQTRRLGGFLDSLGIGSRRDPSPEDPSDSS